MTELQKQDQKVIASPLCPKDVRDLCLLWNLPEGQACDAYISTIPGVPRMSLLS